MKKPEEANKYIGLVTIEGQEEFKLYEGNCQHCGM